MIKKIIIFIIFVVFLIMFFVSGYNIIIWTSDRTKTQKNVKQIYDNVVITEIDDTISTTSKENSKNNLISYYSNMNLMDVDFSKLKGTNDETIGWIKVEGTNINYPIVQTSNNSYYLTHSFDKSYNKAGWVFMDYRNSSNITDQNTIIYAHGRTDKTMFGSLRDTLKDNWLNNKDNHVIRISTEKENSLWQVFSVYKIPTTTDYLQIFFNNNEYQKFLSMIKKRSVFDFNTTITTDDKILTLSTCHNSTYKIVMHAKLIKSSLK